MSKRVGHIVSQLPNKPGCYLMKDSKGKIIYVGKAKDLKKRVSSYFNQSAKTFKTETLVSKINDLDFIVTTSETEAYILENNLIKKYKPRYNILLKDDKTYPYIVIPKNETFPRLIYKRNPVKGKNWKIFGPFPHGSNISLVLRILVKALRLRDCSNREFESRKRPCLLFEMHQCSAPCVKSVSEKEYQEQLEKASQFLAGKNQKVLKELENQMYVYAEKEEFEKAAMIRDQLDVLKTFRKRDLDQRVEGVDGLVEADVVGVAVGQNEIDLSISMIREKNLWDTKHLFFSKTHNDSIEEEIFISLIQYYWDLPEGLPERIILNIEGIDGEKLQNVLCHIDEKIQVLTGANRYAPLIRFANENALEKQKLRLNQSREIDSALIKLKELLSLKEVPNFIECYDIAIWQGASPTASQVVFMDGKALKKSYRYYHLEERPEGNNDFAMLQEVFSRRADHGSFPDLFLVDGGIGQVNAVLEILNELEVDVPVIGIAKERTEQGFQNKEVQQSEERLIIPGRLNPYVLSKFPPLFRLIVQMRDEAHRFCQKLHHHKERKRHFYTWIDDISGVGKKTREIMLAKLDLPFEEIKKMGLQELRSYFGISASMAQKVFDFLQKAS